MGNSLSGFSIALERPSPVGGMARIGEQAVWPVRCRLDQDAREVPFCSSGPAREADRPDRRAGPVGAVLFKTCRFVQDVLPLGQDRQCCLGQDSGYGARGGVFGSQSSVLG
ncbi:MAG: hypothetical protein H7095_02265 [Pseudopedobacter sp.]|nr:hypothetical protein [Deinococcales bacterium]